MSSKTKKAEMKKTVIKTLYDDGAIANDIDELIRRTNFSKDEFEENFSDIQKTLGSPLAVIDPRYLGYSFPSYTFVEMENNLERGFEASRSDFNNPNKAMLLGSVLGDIDLIHRRVDENKWANADFAKWAKGRLTYFEKFETYPVFQIARWHGKDIHEPVNQEPSLLNQSEKDVITALREDPTLVWKIKQNSKNEDITLPNVIQKHGLDLTENVTDELMSDEILLGTSHTFDINSSPWNMAAMGLTLGKESGAQETEPRMDLTDDHDRVIKNLQNLDTEFIDNFHLPFITSGVGQGWADILLEIRFEENHHLESIAKSIRDIDHVETTRTYIMANQIFDHGLEATIQN